MPVGVVVVYSGEEDPGGSVVETVFFVSLALASLSILASFGWTYSAEAVSHVP